MSILYYLLSSLLFYEYTNTLFPRQVCDISLTRGKELRNYWPKGFDWEKEKATDEWWRAELLIDGFNESLNNISVSSLKVGDESISVIRFPTTAKGGLPHFSFILRKPEPLGTELNTVVFSVTRSLLFVEVHRVKEEMNRSKYQYKIGLTVACTKRMTEATNGIGQDYIKGATKDFLFLTVGSPQTIWQNL